MLREIGRNLHGGEMDLFDHLSSVIEKCCGINPDQRSRSKSECGERREPAANLWVTMEKVPSTGESGGGKGRFWIGDDDNVVARITSLRGEQFQDQRKVGVGFDCGARLGADEKERPREILIEFSLDEVRLSRIKDD